MSLRIKDCWCRNCGHPVLAEGVSLLPEDDTDRAGHGRDRCADSACESAGVATYQGGVLVVVERPHEMTAQQRRDWREMSDNFENTAYDRGRSNSFGRFANSDGFRKP